MNEEKFGIQVNAHDRGVVVSLSGDATIENTEEIRSTLQPILERSPARVVLDLAHLAFINSLGLGVLLEFRRDLHAKGTKLRLCGASGRIAEMLRKTRLADLFPMYESADKALQA
jgi:anti-anti-sigma factor